MRGRKPLSDVERVLRGLPPRHATIATAEDLACPWPLSGVALAEWNRLTPLLRNRGLGPGELGALYLLCMTWAEFVRLSAHVTEHGCSEETASGSRKLSPEGKQLNETRSFLLRLLAEHGMTPVTRSRVVADALEGPSPLDALRQDWS